MKIMFISDIHLRNYHRYNKFPTQRLLSFLELAKDIVSKGIEEGITDLIIGGDLIDKSTLSPKEIHILFNMYTILIKQFNVYSIIGNHDMVLKKGEFERNDSIITLLEEIVGTNSNTIRFFHQEVLTLGGRTIAFENWVPEFDLSWMKEPTDIYVSHATIDYDNCGFFGMDTSVFEGKFTLGFFGDIHVRREIENYISIGNTKQESLSDRWQGGGIILDTKDLSWERFDIDPEHIKYLHLTTTDELELEGWVDAEGEDMTYRIYKPAKVNNSTVNFTLPKTTDIEEKLNQIMKELDLLDLHNSIKSGTDYMPIDFNFKLQKLIIKNFRSITDYTLDFDEDYIVTGPNGSGKSTMITALFYAMIGKKTLKSEVTFGEKDCTLTLYLTYQNQDFIITRGTGGGEYGLTINNVVQKYNNKLEFEKDVYSHLPFLNYHEAIFFNYWDTELLGTMKLDRRFDLVAKFFRLDALTDYFDVGNLRLKDAKKLLKDTKDEFDKLLAKYEYTKQLNETLSLELEGAKPKSELVELMDNYKLKRDYSKSLNELSQKRSNFLLEFDRAKAEMESAKASAEVYRDKLKGAKPEKDLELAIENYSTRSQLQNRYDKGKTLTDGKKNDLNISKSNLEMKKEALTLVSAGELKPEVDSTKLDELSNVIADESSRVSNELYVTSKDIEKWKLEISKVEKEIEDTSKITNCSGCGKPLSMEDKLKTYNALLKELKGKLKIDEDLFEKAKKNEEEFKSVTLPKLVNERDTIVREINEVKVHNKRVRDNEELMDSKKNEILALESSISKLEEDLVTYSNTLSSIETELRSLPFISEAENVTNQILSASYKDYAKSVMTYGEKVEVFEGKERIYLKETEELTNKIKDLDDKLEELKEVDEDSNLTAALLIAKYNDKELYEARLSSEIKSISELDNTIVKLEKNYTDLDTYCQLTSRSGDVLKSTLEDLTKTFSNGQFRFSTNKAQASGKLVTDMSVEYLVGKQWVTYPALSSGQKTLCDLYFISKVVTGVGVMSFDETLRFLDSENMKIASELISDIKKHNLLISTHSPDLHLMDAITLYCTLDKDSRTKVSIM